jgi:hypothetical protein
LLRANNFNFNRIHVQKFRYKPAIKYLIVLRNPIERFISSFYWRKHLVLNGQKNRFAGEYDFFQKFTTIEGLIQNDITILEKQYVHHLKEDIHYYLGDFADQCNPNNIIGVICTENLNNDIENIFNIQAGVHKNNNSKNKKELKEEYGDFLKKYLYKDYLVIEKLNNLKLLSEEQYGILSK